MAILTWNNIVSTNQQSGKGVRLEKEMATHASVLAWEIPWT